MVKDGPGVYVEKLKLVWRPFQMVHGCYDNESPHFLLFEGSVKSGHIVCVMFVVRRSIRGRPCGSEIWRCRISINANGFKKKKTGCHGNCSRAKCKNMAICQIFTNAFFTLLHSPMVTMGIIEGWGKLFVNWLSRSIV